MAHPFLSYTLVQAAPLIHRLGALQAPSQHRCCLARRLCSETPLKICAGALNPPRMEVAQRGKVGFPGIYRAAWERRTWLWSRRLVSFPCGSPRRLNRTQPLAMVPQRSDRPPILTRYLSTWASEIYRGRPVPSVKFLLKMLKSCDNPSGEEGIHPHRVPGQE